MTPDPDPTDGMNVQHEGTPGSNSVGDGTEFDIADPNDVLFAQRGDDGEPIPVPQKIPGRDQALRVVPPTEGFYNKYLDPVPADDNEKVAELLEKGFPDLDGVTAHDVENGLLIFGLETAVDMLERAGGHDMHSAMQEREEQQNMAQIETMMDAMGVDRDEDMTTAEFLEAMQDMDMGDEEGEGAEEAEGEGAGEAASGGA